MGKRLHFYTFLTYICLIICKRFMAFFLFCIKKRVLCDGTQHFKSVWSWMSSLFNVAAVREEKCCCYPRSPADRGQAAALSLSSVSGIQRRAQLDVTFLVFIKWLQWFNILPHPPACLKSRLSALQGTFSAGRTVPCRDSQHILLLKSRNYSSSCRWLNKQ